MKIKEFYRQNVTLTQNDEFERRVGLGAKKLTRLLNGTDEWNNEQLQALSELTNRHPLEIVAECELPNCITLTQAEELKQWWERNHQEDAA